MRLPTPDGYINKSIMLFPCVPSIRPSLKHHDQFAVSDLRRSTDWPPALSPEMCEHHGPGAEIHVVWLRKAQQMSMSDQELKSCLHQQSAGT